MELCTNYYKAQAGGVQPCKFLVLLFQHVSHPMHESGPPPPIYSQQDPDHVGVLLSDRQSSSAGHGIQDPQIIIIPTVDALNFQKGFLGADGERAAVEGELQIKGVDPLRYNRVYVRHVKLVVCFGNSINMQIYISTFLGISSRSGRH